MTKDPVTGQVEVESDLQRLRRIKEAAKTEEGDYHPFNLFLRGDKSDLGFLIAKATRQIDPFYPVNTEKYLHHHEAKKLLESMDEWRIWRGAGVVFATVVCVLIISYAIVHFFI